MLLNNQLFPIILYKNSKFKKNIKTFFTKSFFTFVQLVRFHGFYNRVGVCKKIVSNFVSR